MMPILHQPDRGPSYFCQLKMLLRDPLQATASPFINAIFDREPLQRWVWGRVALVGEAAHPTTPHGLRSTNMAIADAGALGQAFAAHKGDVGAALQQYQERRLAATTREVHLNPKP